MAGEHQGSDTFSSPVDDIQKQLGDAPQIMKVKPRICLWEHLSRRQIRTYLSLTSAEAKRRFVRSEFVREFPEDVDESSLEGVMCELYCNTLEHCLVERGYNEEQTSAYFSIIYNTHRMVTGSSQNDLDHCFQTFKLMLLRHGLHRPPQSLLIFSLKELQHLMDYTINTYFANFYLYKYAFTPKILLQVEMCEVAQTGNQCRSTGI